jgi:hypothetical protein
VVKLRFVILKKGIVVNLRLCLFLEIINLYLTIATIFIFSANEEEPDGLLPEEDFNMFLTGFDATT